MLAPLPTVPSKTDRGTWSTVLGDLDGFVVTGTYSGRSLVYCSIVFGGLQVQVLGPDIMHLSIGEGLGMVGDLRVAEWRIVEQLATAHLVGRLVELFKRYETAQGGLNCETCGAELQADDEELMCSRCAMVRRLAMYAALPSAELARLTQRLGA